MTSDRLTPGSVQPSIYSAFSALRAASDTLSTVRDTDTPGNHVQSEIHNSPGPPLLSIDFPFPSPSPTDSSPQDSPTPSAHSPQWSASIPLSTGLTPTGNSIYPSADDDESSTEDDPLAHFVSVRDLQNNPGCTALDFTEYRPITQTNDTEVPETSTQASDVQSPTAQPVDRGRDWLPRGAKVNMGYTENHAMQSDITTDGKLTPNFISRKGEFISLYSYGKDKPNWQLAWVQPSHFCPRGGYGFFFQVPPGRTIPAGTLIRVYSGRDNISPSLSFDRHRHGTKAISGKRLCSGVSTWEVRSGREKWTKNFWPRPMQ
jgi:hypothetical protein